VVESNLANLNFPTLQKLWNSPSQCSTCNCYMLYKMSNASNLRSCCQRCLAYCLALRVTDVSRPMVYGRCASVSPMQGSCSPASSTFPLVFSSTVSDDAITLVTYLKQQKQQACWQSAQLLNLCLVHSVYDVHIMTTGVITGADILHNLGMITNWHLYRIQVFIQSGMMGVQQLHLCRTWICFCISILIWKNINHS